MPTNHSHDINQFDDQANQWWNLNGAFKPLHDINAFRLDYIKHQAQIKNSRFLDVGCGGGILSEALATEGAEVTGIDTSLPSIQVAREHAQQNGLNISYRHSSPEDFLATGGQKTYDVVVCMELLEHVAKPAQLVKACANAVKPNGQVFFSTINRGLSAYLLAILAAEYILKLVPKKTHAYRQFIKPSELAKWCREAGLAMDELSGFRYIPFTTKCYLTTPDVNYIANTIKFDTCL